MSAKKVNQFLLYLTKWKTNVIFFSFRSSSEVTHNEEVTTTTSSSAETTTKKKRKHKQQQQLSDDQRLLTDMSDERLQGYGLNPKRFRNFVRFNKDNKN